MYSNIKLKHLFFFLYVKFVNFSFRRKSTACRISGIIRSYRKVLSFKRKIITPSNFYRIHDDNSTDSELFIVFPVRIATRSPIARNGIMRLKRRFFFFILLPKVVPRIGLNTYSINRVEIILFFFLIFSSTTTIPVKGGGEQETWWFIRSSRNRRRNIIVILQ